MWITNLTLTLCLGLAACGGESDPTPDASSGDDQTPPTGKLAVEAWLARGDYKAWACEPTVHAAREPSPHGFNRICSNDAIAANASSANAWPEGAAGVKELYASATATTPIGYAVYMKQAADSAGGANWYWYERVGEDVIADGAGTAGAAKEICVGCHAGAGSDAAHTPSPGARDQVYTAVP